jgi:predicted nucleic acid-binding protein
MTSDDRADIETLRQALGPQVVGFTAVQWATAGRCLAFYATQWGRIRPRDHIADVLIALTARALNGVVVSENVADMRRWSLVLFRVLHGPRLQVRTLVNGSGRQARESR